MSRAPAKFTESDVRRVLVAARKAQCCVRIEIEKDGRITIVTGGKPDEATSDEGSSWDKAIADLEAQ
jgi:hypothetical protein